MQGQAKEKDEKRVRGRIFDKPIRRERLARWGAELFWGGVGYVLGYGEMLFGTFPLGMALLCASARHTVAILIGLSVSAVLRMEAPWIYLCAYAAAALIRGVCALLSEHASDDAKLAEALRIKLSTESTSSSDDEAPQNAIGRRLQPLRRLLSELFRESVCMRMAIAAVCTFLISLYRIVAGGFQYYDLFAALFSVVVAPAAVAVYAIDTDGSPLSAVWRKISRGALLFSAVWAANSLTLFGLPFSVMIAFFATLYSGALDGIAVGAVTGLLCGVAYHPLYAPALLMASLTCSLLYRKGREQGAAAAACLVLVLWAIYVGGAEVMLTLLPACLLTGTVFTLYCKIFHTAKETSAEAAEESEDETSARIRLDGERYRDSNERFRGISDAFSSLSEMFYNLSDRFRRPGTLDLRRLCDNSFDAFCKDCPNKTVCWGLEYANTLGTVNGLISRLHTRGKVSREQIPEAMLHRCDTVDSILDKINRDCATLTGEMLRNNRTEIFAMDYEAAASIINDALEEDDGEYRFDPELEQKIGEYLGDAGVRAVSVTVYGNRRRQIVIRGADLEQAKITSETLRGDLGEMCGLELSRPVLEVEGHINTMTLRAKKKIAVEGAHNNVSADGGVSGDSVNLFSNKADYFYALISDGMGAGTEAALTSGLCSVFLEKMLRAGNRAWTSLRMLNNMIRSRGADSLRECSSTIDLLEVDLMTAQASFIKSGAAPSFVVRGKTVHRLQSGTAPIGIIRALDAQATSFSLRPGDTVVLISDGILLNDPECEWISAYLEEVAEQTPEEIVYRICLHAAECENHDDCSAVALRIRGAEE